MKPDPLSALHAQIISCERCPRLVEYRARIAREKRRAFRDEVYWGRPVPGLGDQHARLLIVGLAPAAHGANRTGRNFTGDSSGDFLFAALHRAGFANQPVSKSRDDGLELLDTYITAAVRCAPPDNKPLPEEIANCQPYLDRELQLLTNVSVIVALGRIGFETCLSALERRGIAIPKPKPLFGHGRVYRLAAVSLIASYHPSRQNTQTGKLTRAMFDRIFRRARKLLSARAVVPGSEQPGWRLPSPTSSKV